MGVYETTILAMAKILNEWGRQVSAVTDTLTQDNVSPVNTAGDNVSNSTR